MWQEDNDKILKILDCLYDKKKHFPVNCPICAKKDGHIYLYRHNINSHSGGLCGIVKKCAVRKYPKSKIGMYQAT